MDGNRRWATARGLPAAAGHRAGAHRLRGLLDFLLPPGGGPEAFGVAPCGVEALTVFALSTENLGRRDHIEVGLLRALFEETLRREAPVLADRGVRLKVVGEPLWCERGEGPFEWEGLRQAALEAERLTEGGQFPFTVALGYGARRDLVLAARKLAARSAEQLIDPGSIAEEDLEGLLALGGLGLPTPDLLIRPGGERRLSNFLLWELAYAELHFCDSLWPDFSAGDFQNALDWFATRERRFGD